MIEVQYYTDRKSGCTENERSRILKYMQSGKGFCAAPSIRTDIVSGEPLPVYDFDLTDGKYLWNSAATYYFEKYDFDLSDEFKKHVLSLRGGVN